MRFGSIRFICFNHVYLEDQAVKDLLSACPNLEVLEINSCLGPHHLEICSTSLKRLILEFGYIPKKKQTLLVDCPKLCSISIDSCDFEECVLKNASSLVEFHVDFLHRIDGSYRPWSNVVRLLEQAPNVKHLNVQNWWFKESLPEELLKKPVHFSMPSLKQVKMKAFNGGQDHILKILIEQGVVLEKIVLLPKILIDQVGQNEPLPPIILNREVSQAWEIVDRL